MKNSNDQVNERYKAAVKVGNQSAFVFIFTAALALAFAPLADKRSFVVRWQTSSYNPASRPEFKDHYLKTATDTTGSSRGLRRDTTAVFEIQPYMSFKVTMTSAATDSAAKTFILYTAEDNQFRRRIPAWSEFTVADSIVLTGETTQPWIVTDSPISVDKYGFVIERGNAANCKTEAVTSRLLYAGDGKQ